MDKGRSSPWELMVTSILISRGFSNLRNKAIYHTNLTEREAPSYPIKPMTKPHMNEGYRHYRAKTTNQK